VASIHAFRIRHVGTTPRGFTRPLAAIVFAINSYSGKSEEATSSELFAVDAGDGTAWGLVEDELKKRLTGVASIEVLDLPSVTEAPSDSR